MVCKKFYFKNMGNFPQKQLLDECQKLNNVENVKDLLQQGMNINIVNHENGACALHHAAKWSDSSMIKFLIASGISVM